MNEKFYLVTRDQIPTNKIFATKSLLFFNYYNKSDKTKFELRTGDQILHYYQNIIKTRTATIPKRIQLKYLKAFLAICLPNNLTI